MKIGITFGVFDLLHLGHFQLFKKLKLQCDHLIVCVHDDIFKIKNIDFIHSINERELMLKSIREIDEVKVYHRVDLDIVKINFDIFFYGPDQDNIYFSQAKEWAANKNKTTIQIDRTKDISSSKIRNILINSKYHKI